jgi:hypothetical protein
MKEYAVKVTETLEKVVYVQAENMYNAEEIAQEQYNRGEYILDADNFVGVEFEIESEV